MDNDVEKFSIKGVVCIKGDVNIYSLDDMQVTSDNQMETETEMDDEMDDVIYYGGYDYVIKVNDLYFSCSQVDTSEYSSCYISDFNNQTTSNLNLIETFPDCCVVIANNAEEYEGKRLAVFTKNSEIIFIASEHDNSVDFYDEDNRQIGGRYKPSFIIGWAERFLNFQIPCFNQKTKELVDRIIESDLPRLEKSKFLKDIAKILFEQDDRAIFSGGWYDSLKNKFELKVSEHEYRQKMIMDGASN